MAWVGTSWPSLPGAVLESWCVWPPAKGLARLLPSPGAAQPRDPSLHPGGMSPSRGCSRRPRAVSWDTTPGCSRAAEGERELRVVFDSALGFCNLLAKQRIKREKKKGGKSRARAQLSRGPGASAAGGGQPCPPAPTSAAPCPSSPAPTSAAPCPGSPAPTSAAPCPSSPALTSAAPCPGSPARQLPLLSPSPWDGGTARQPLRVPPPPMLPTAPRGTGMQPSRQRDALRGEGSGCGDGWTERRPWSRPNVVGSQVPGGGHGWPPKRPRSRSCPRRGPGKGCFRDARLVGSFRASRSP